MASTLFIAQHLIRGRDFFEAVVGVSILVEIGVVFPCQLFVGLSDGGLVGIFRDAQNGVQISQCFTRLWGL